MLWFSELLTSDCGSVSGESCATLRFKVVLNSFCHVCLQSWPWTLVVPQLRGGLSEVCVAGGAERCVSKRTVCLPNTTRQLGLGVELWQVMQRQSPCSHLLCSCAVCVATMGQACLNLNPFPNPEPRTSRREHKQPQTYPALNPNFHPKRSTYPEALSYPVP